MTALDSAAGSRPVATARRAVVPPRPALDVVYQCAFAVVGIAIGMRPLHDNSFLWHVRTGELILDSGIPHDDPYSFTAPGARWVAQSWLAELLYGVVDRAAGGFGLRLLGGLVGAGLATAAFRLAHRLANDRLRAGALTASMLLVILNVWSERPLMLGIAAMLALAVCVEDPAGLLGRHPTVVLPVLLWLWANVHGTFVLGLGYLALHLAGRALEGRRPSRGRERALLRGGVAGALATVCNPYGIDLPLFPFRLMARGAVLDNVSEWQSPDFREAGAQLFAMWIVVVIVLCARRRPGTRDLLVAVAFLLLGLWAVRNVGLAAVATLPIVARLARNPQPRRAHANRLDRVLVVVSLCAVPLAVVHAAGRHDWDLDRYPVDAYAAIEARGLAGRRLVTTDAWGGYLIAAEWPAQRVFFDDRYDMYPVSVQRDYDALAGVTPRWIEVLDRYRAELVMWPRRAALVQALAEHDGWVRLHDDEVAVVFARRGAVPAPG